MLRQNGCIPGFVIDCPRQIQRHLEKRVSRPSQATLCSKLNGFLSREDSLHVAACHGSKDNVMLWTRQLEAFGRGKLTVMDMYLTKNAKRNGDGRFRTFTPTDAWCHIVIPSTGCLGQTNSSNALLLVGTNGACRRVGIGQVDSEHAARSPSPFLTCDAQSAQELWAMLRGRSSSTHGGLLNFSSGLNALLLLCYVSLISLRSSHTAAISRSRHLGSSWALLQTPRAASAMVGAIPTCFAASTPRARSLMHSGILNPG